jgi:hypothetical protein
MNSEWCGRIEDLGIVNILWLIAHQGSTGSLEVGEGEDRVCVGFEAGKVLRAGPLDEVGSSALADGLSQGNWVQASVLEVMLEESAELAQSLETVLVANEILTPGELDEIGTFLNRETIFKLLLRSRGSFEFRLQPSPRRKHWAPPLDLAEILGEADPMLEEWLRLQKLIPCQESIFEAVGPVGPYCQRLLDRGRTGTDQIRRVFACVNGIRSVERVVELSRLGTFEATRILAELRRVGLIDLAYRKSPEPERWRSLRSSIAGLGEYFGALGAASLCLFLLASVAAIGLRGGSASERAGIRVMSASPLAQGRAQYERLRVDYAVEGKRLESLIGFEASLLGLDRRMATDRASAYNSSQRGEGAPLLSPPD